MDMMSSIDPAKISPAVLANEAARNCLLPMGAFSTLCYSFPKPRARVGRSMKHVGAHGTTEHTTLPQYSV